MSFASAMAVVTLNIHHRGLRGTEVPDVIKKYILNYLSRLKEMVLKSAKKIFIRVLLTQGRLP